MTYQERLPEIEALVQETFSLWNEQRVGFSWRHYYWNHTRRVRALAVALGRREGADLDVVAYAATLHDLTKRYDGAIALDADGKRQLDANGYWINETLPPARHNRVTRLYAELGLAGQVHHLSGATLTEHLLREAGFDTDFIAAVAHVIRAHVKPERAAAAEIEALYRPAAARALHDADLMDANLGLVAFYRNIQIYAGRAAQSPGGVDPRAYVESIGRWVGTKDAFLDRLMTAAGREVGRARQERNRQVVEWVAEEEAQGETAWQYGLRGVITYLLKGYQDPSLALALRGLGEEWLPARAAELEQNGQAPHARALLERSRRFHDLLAAEVAGQA